VDKRDGNLNVPLSSEVAVPNSPQVSDRRVGYRCSCSLSAICEPIPPGTAGHFSGTVQNISENGIGLLVDRELAAGSSLWVVMRGADDVLLGKMMIQIIHATRQPDGQWLHGCLFTKEGSEPATQSATKRSLTDSSIEW
jgi:PilZ domain